MMQKDELCLLIRDLAEQQAAYAGLMSLALVYHLPDDSFMLAMYEVQDRMQLQLRSLLRELPGADPELLERFDVLLMEKRLNLLLTTADVRPLAD
ncbi:hypothetical protein AAFN85_26875 [Mucilaginibacter sp. CAU 1740]|uniref:hypothetical protein n=1 Tax=Mucilaginibacter sp. CAU 1740 TaxID=3140365 RepID=UPI00325A8AD4